MEKRTPTLAEELRYAASLHQWYAMCHQEKARKLEDEAEQWEATKALTKTTQEEV